MFVEILRQRKISVREELSFGRLLVNSWKQSHSREQNVATVFSLFYKSLEFLQWALNFSCEDCTWTRSVYSFT